MWKRPFGLATPRGISKSEGGLVVRQPPLEKHNCRTDLNFFENGGLHLMEVSLAESGASGTTRGAARDGFDGMNLLVSCPLLFRTIPL